MDGAHNADAAKKLAASIETYFPGKKLFYIMGVFKDTEYEKVIRITAPYAARVTAVETPGNPRALPREELKKAWEVHHVPVMTADSIEQAVKEDVYKRQIHDIVKNSYDKPDILMSPEIAGAMQGLRSFLFDHVYYNPEAKQEERKAREMIQELYRYYNRHADRMPKEYLELIHQKSQPQERVVCDYIAVKFLDQMCIRDS